MTAVPLPRLLVDDRQDVPVDVPSLLASARAALAGEGATGSEVSISLVGEDEMADLHQRYLGEEGPTDVLSFPIGERDPEGVLLLGDVVICPVAARAASGDPAAELRLLIVHGILHLLGYDHEREEERAEMWTRQERYSGVAA